MPETHSPILFPTLSGSTWEHVDLDAEARAAFGVTGTNPLLDPDACAAFVDRIARRLGCDHTYGGYLEDRSTLWRGHYHRPGHTLHLGVDYNVPAGTPVAAAADATIVRVARDPDGDGGWGGVVFARLDIPYRSATHVVYGHLAHRGLPSEGDRMRGGMPFATIGVAAENGGWFPHLHVQCFTDAVAASHGHALEAMDGYGPVDAPGWRSAPNPIDLVDAGPRR